MAKARPICDWQLKATPGTKEWNLGLEPGLGPVDAWGGWAWLCTVSVAWSVRSWAGFG